MLATFKKNDSSKTSEHSMNDDSFIVVPTKRFSILDLDPQSSPTRTTTAATSVTASKSPSKSKTVDNNVKGERKTERNL